MGIKDGLSNRIVVVAVERLHFYQGGSVTQQRGGGVQGVGELTFSAVARSLGAAAVGASAGVGSAAGHVLGKEGFLNWKKKKKKSFDSLVI